MHLTVLLDAARCRTTDDFLIRDVPGTSGRLDVVCRVLAATFRTAPKWNPFVEFLAVLGGPPEPPLLLRVSDVSDEGIPEGELALAVILKGLLNLHRTVGKERLAAWRQFSLSRQGFEETLRLAAKDKAQVCYLVERGTPLESLEFNLAKPLVFVLGDDRGLPLEHEALLSRYPVKEVAMGKQSLLGSQVVSLLLLELARRSKLDAPNHTA
jgi:tRNA (pseudouridine54-N1)-methyltransferase